VDAFVANSVKQHQNAQNNSAEHQPQQTRLNVGFTAVHPQARKQTKADSAAPNRKPFTAETRAKRGPHVHWLHDDCVT
jgi:hypothetical protein